MTQLNIKKRTANRFPKVEGLSAVAVHALFSPYIVPPEGADYKECHYFALPHVQANDAHLPTLMRFFASQIHKFVFPKTKLTVRSLDTNAMMLSLATEKHRRLGNATGWTLQQQVLGSLQVDKVDDTGRTVHTDYEKGTSKTMNNSSYMFVGTAQFKSRANSKTVEAINNKIHAMLGAEVAFFNKSELHPSFKVRKRMGRALWAYKAGERSPISTETNALPALDLQFTFPAYLKDETNDRSGTAILKRFNNA